MSRGPTLTHRLEYLALIGVGAVLRTLPERAGTGFSEGLGSFAGRVLRVRRAVVDENLRIALPELSDGERKRVAVHSYRHLAREGGLLLESTVRPPNAQALCDRSHWADPESEATFRWLKDRSDRGRGSLVLTGHLGNWELAGATLAALGVPVLAVAVAQRNQLFDDRLRLSREQLGLTLISRDAAVRTVPAALAAGKTVAIVADQHSQRGVRLPFFGRTVRAARGPAVFALRSGVPAVLGVLTRDPGWPPRYTRHVRRIPYERSGVVADDVRGLTSAYLGVLESYVRRFPDQYMWQHKRWRDD